MIGTAFNSPLPKDDDEYDYKGDSQEETEDDDNAIEKTRRSLVRMKSPEKTRNPVKTTPTRKMMKRRGLILSRPSETPSRDF